MTERLNRIQLNMLNWCGMNGLRADNRVNDTAAAEVEIESANLTKQTLKQRVLLRHKVSRGSSRKERIEYFEASKVGTLSWWTLVFFQKAGCLVLGLGKRTKGRVQRRKKGIE
jgi:hypothetical protein